MSERDFVARNKSLYPASRSLLRRRDRSGATNNGRLEPLADHLLEARLDLRQLGGLALEDSGLARRLAQSRCVLVALVQQP